EGALGRKRVHASSKDEALGAQPKEIAGPLAGRDCGTALRKPQVEVGLVGRLVLGKACVAGDGQDRAVHFRLCVDVGPEPRQELAESQDQRSGRLEEVLLVVAAVGLEPLAAVVGGEAVEEGEQFGLEAPKGDGHLGEQHAQGNSPVLIELMFYTVAYCCSK